MLQDNIFIIL